VFVDDAGNTVKKGEANRKLIINAANKLFYEKGYNQTAFSEVAEVSRIPKGNFYYYFKSKDELLEAVIDDRLNGIRQMLKEWDREYPEPRQRLLRYAEIPLNELDGVVRYGCPMGSLNVELGKSQLVLQSRATEMFTLFLEWLQQQFMELQYGKVESRNLALHLISVLQGATLIGNVYRDPAFIEREVSLIKEWIVQQ
jgi:AcrR family transcriptional regulator